jgi:hypothetical protein
VSTLILSTTLKEWTSYIDERIKQLVPQPAGSFPAIQGGSFVESNPGWYTVRFNPAFSGVPTVLAVQGARGTTPQNLTLTPPKLSAPTVSPYTVSKANLTSLQIPVPATQQTWGAQAKQFVVNNCRNTIGKIPVIGGYICSGIDSTFGALFEIVGNAMQAIHYATDLPALLSAVEQQVQAKAAADYNLMISALQYDINEIISNIDSALANGSGDVNAALADLTSIVQQGINTFYNLINSAIGLAEDLSIPVAQIRNLNSVSVDIYHPGSDATVYWVALVL